MLRLLQLKFAEFITVSSSAVVGYRRNSDPVCPFTKLSLKVIPSVRFVLLTQFGLGGCCSRLASTPPTAAFYMVVSVGSASLAPLLAVIASLAHLDPVIASNARLWPLFERRRGGVQCKQSAQSVFITAARPRRRLAWTSKRLRSLA